MSHIYTSPRSAVRLARTGVLASLFYAGLATVTIGVYTRFHSALDIYDTAILFGAATLLTVCGRGWRAFRHFTLAMMPVIVVCGFLLPSVAPVHSQTLILATGITVWTATLLFMTAWITRSVKMFYTARAATWIAIGIGVLAFLLRWKESYAMGSGVGHIPVSNLYEVFLVFILLTSSIMLYLIDAFDTPELAAFAMPVVSAATGFLFWYGAARGAGSIEPLIPALQSYWMKLHVPANFIAYGAFSIAATSSSAWLLARFPFFARRLPERVWIEEITYRAVATGFVFFTIATILGALWAAEAWGGYWSWDPKETWALVVWLNYAAWLHMRLVKKLRGAPLAWWALIGLFVTIFAFLGVNMYLAGLHSYGAL